MPTVGVFVYFEKNPAIHAEVAHAAASALLDETSLPVDLMRMSLYRTPRKKSKWRKFKWSAFDEAVGDELVEVIDLCIGSKDDDVSFHGMLELRCNPDPRLRSDAPRQFSFSLESSASASIGLADTAHRIFEVCARGAEILSGGCFRGESFVQADCEVDYPFSYEHESKEFKERLQFDRMHASDRWTKARRLYPITLLGPKLANQLSAADALAAGALAVQELNGSLLIDAYPSIVETWDPEFLRTTVNLRRWLWPHTIQNPADAVGLGVKVPKR
ncbi:MAG: hypothetical protein R3B48_24280 [Kofleriaceae bacterium]